MDLANRYTTLLLSLMPRGAIWQSMGCSSWFKTLLETLAEEYARFHVWLVLFIESTIKNFAREKHGWSCKDYQNLLKTKFGIDAEVVDSRCQALHVDNADADSWLWDQKYIYMIFITVDDIKKVPQAVKDYLNKYKQSHTAICWRNKPTAHELWDIEPLNTDNAYADSDVYTQYFHAVEIQHHPSYELDELIRIISLPPFKDTRIFIKPATRIGNFEAGSKLLKNDVIEHIKTKLYYKLETLCTL